MSWDRKTHREIALSLMIGPPGPTPEIELCNQLQALTHAVLALTADRRQTDDATT